MARVRAGDAGAYGDLVRAHAGVALRVAVLLGAGADAEDVVQESLVKAYRALGGFRDGAPFRPWLLRIVANETNNLRRSARRRGATEVAALLPEPVADPELSVQARAQRAELVRAVEVLPESYRLVVTCRYLLDLDERETATVLGWPRGTVKSRLSRALRRLRTSLETDPADD
ncbi:RNA polymerase sigma factor RpoE [Alloactinosynnema sp. L-07]|uniref:RNA polymerase sigma factor n=1 Tax=Alloactinosynnema sp. L-07 TaxID=1653480 RepID=UPI00065F00DC|nr:sigma-70 family RNA polymerase sigma factor [Alloactinosynnema sp. L-07]CRK56560.1 RNA polymerase sigma factor RpoE [Alloactinosynnema sp. L-07]